MQDLESLGYSANQLAFRASAGLLAYIWENMKDGFPRFERIELYELSGYVSIDVHTRKNLELTETIRDNTRNNFFTSLFANIFIHHLTQSHSIYSPCHEQLLFFSVCPDHPQFSYAVCVYTP